MLLRQQTLALLLPLLLLVAPAAALTVPLGLDSFLSGDYARDPSATNDSFLLLPARLRRALAGSASPSLSASATANRLLSLSVAVPVSVHLVGAAFSPSAPSLIHSFATAAISSAPFLSVAAPHSLAVSHSLHLSVSTAASAGLASRLADAIRRHLDASPAPFHKPSLSSVPYSAIDSIIADDFAASSTSSPAFHIYLLSLGAQSRPYAYSDDAAATGDSSPGWSSCLGTVWTGQGRYIWIDLGAGPVDWGPALSGDGVVPHGEFHPLNALHGRPRPERSLLADLASLVLSAYKSLLVPPLRIPVHYENSLTIRFFHIYSTVEKDSAGLDWKSIENVLRQGDVAYKGQSLQFTHHSIKFSDCSICSFAVARSLNSYTSRFLFDNYTLIVSEYLDSKQLHRVLSDSSEELHRLAGLQDEYYERVIPVFAFDLDYDRLLLLDRHHQAIAFRNMVIAVRTKTTQTVSDYSCNGRHVITQTRNLERPIIGSVLQSMWGVSPTHLSWSPEHNDTLIDYTWSVGQTPFGPFSVSSTLSFVQHDAARRNVLLTTLNYTISSLIDVLDSMDAHGGGRMLLKKKRHLEFAQRMNLLNYKIDKLVSALSQLDYDKAMYFLRSSDHDLYAIHKLVFEASQELEASLVCFKDPPFPWVSVSLSGVFVGGFFYVYSKRDQIFRSKRKQF